MDKNLYASLASRASDLVSAGQHKEALSVLQTLIDSDLPDFDKAMMCLNVAIVYDKMQNTKEALSSYAQAMDYERKTGSYFVAQHRAAYFSRLGLYDESIRCYEELLRLPVLKEEDRAAFSSNVSTLEGLRRQGRK